MTKIVTQPSRRQLKQREMNRSCVFGVGWGGGEPMERLGESGGCPFQWAPQSMLQTLFTCLGHYSVWGRIGRGAEPPSGVGPELQAALSDTHTPTSYSRRSLSQATHGMDVVSQSVTRSREPGSRLDTFCGDVSAQRRRGGLCLVGLSRNLLIQGLMWASAITCTVPLPAWT